MLGPNAVPTSHYGFRTLFNMMFSWTVKDRFGADPHFGNSSFSRLPYEVEPVPCVVCAFFIRVWIRRRFALFCRNPPDRIASGLNFAVTICFQHVRFKAVSEGSTLAGYPQSSCSACLAWMQGSMNCESIRSFTEELRLDGCIYGSTGVGAQKFWMDSSEVSGEVFLCSNKFRSRFLCAPGYDHEFLMVASF